jgi:hypothetical protein
MTPTREVCESGKSGRYWVYGNQVPFSPKEDLVQGRLEHTPSLPKGIIQPLGHPRRGDRSIHSSESRWHEVEAPGGRRRSSQVLELPRRWLRLDPSCHGWPCVMKPWWSSRAVPWIHQDTCTFDGDINLTLSLLLIYFDAYLLSFMCVDSIWP